MEQSRLFLERHPGYKDDGLHDENQSNSESDEIDQPKSRRLYGNITTPVEQKC